jgi:hypothetical protein
MRTVRRRSEENCLTRRAWPLCEQVEEMFDEYSSFYGVTTERVQMLTAVQHNAKYYTEPVIEQNPAVGFYAIPISSD